MIKFKNDIFFNKEFFYKDQSNLCKRKAIHTFHTIVLLKLLSLVLHQRLWSRHPNKIIKRCNIISWFYDDSVIHILNSGMSLFKLLSLQESFSFCTEAPKRSVRKSLPPSLCFNSFVNYFITNTPCINIRWMRKCHDWKPSKTTFPDSWVFSMFRLYFMI